MDSDYLFKLTLILTLKYQAGAHIPKPLIYIFCCAVVSGHLKVWLRLQPLEGDKHKVFLLFSSLFFVVVFVAKLDVDSIFQH